MGRISQRFEALAGETALVTFITAGDPTLAHTVPAMHALVEGGTDIIELGVPFSDPEAEGPAIQASSERALENGTRMADVLQMVREFRLKDQVTPIVLMGYLNSVLAHDDFAEQAGSAGVDGLIMVNLPPEEGGELQAALAARDIDLIYLVAPTTTQERARMILSKGSGFIYYVSLKGTTGAGHLDTASVAEKLAWLKTVGDVPVCVGFGIKDESAARTLGQHADGVVVGSAIVNLMAEHSDDVAACAEALKQAAAELNRGAKQR